MFDLLGKHEMGGMVLRHSFTKIMKQEKGKNKANDGQETLTFPLNWDLIWAMSCSILFKFETNKERVGMVIMPIV